MIFFQKTISFDLTYNFEYKYIEIRRLNSKSNDENLVVKGYIF